MSNTMFLKTLGGCRVAIRHLMPWASLVALGSYVQGGLLSIYYNIRN